MAGHRAADWEGIQFNGYRNVSPQQFNDFEEYRLDEPALLPPDTSIWDEVDSLRLPILAPPTEQRAVYTTKTLELGNEAMPTYAERYNIANTALSNTFSFLVGETGCGKSTQVPQILMDAGFKHVYVTQPRRMAARNVYLRIKEELTAKLGAEEAEQLVSFVTAGEREGSEDARIQIVTDGIEVLRQLEDDMEEGDIVVPDEIHEDNLNVETIFAWSKRVGAKNPNLRFMFLSATVDAQDRAHFLEEVTSQPVPIIEVAGRQHKIEYHEEPESDGVKEAIKAATMLHEADDSDLNRVLVVVPGKPEIESYIDEIRKGLPPHVAKQAHIFGLHAKMPPSEQQAAIRHYKSGVSITVATKVVQTSLTIPDVKVVVDTGYERGIRLDQEGSPSLVLRQISQADCKQRAGRAGRVADGIAILTRLGAEFPFLSFDEREPYGRPAIWDTPLADLTLRLAAKDVSVDLVDFYHPPSPEEIERGRELLRKIGGLTLANEVAEIGYRMDDFHIGVVSARMLAESEDRRFTRNVRTYMSALVAAKEQGGLQYFAHNVGKEWQSLSDETDSDLLTGLDLFIATQEMDSVQLRQHDLDEQNVVRARQMYRKLARHTNSFQRLLAPPTQDEREALKECIQAGYTHSMFRHVGGGLYRQIGGPDTAVPRTLSSRSTVKGTPEFVVGEKFQVERWRKGEKSVEDTVENVTEAHPQTLGRYAAAVGLVSPRSEGFVWRDGVFKLRLSKWIGDVNLHDSVEVVADATMHGVREAAIKRAIEEAPGPNQKRARHIKGELETFAHLAKGVPQLTHDMLLKLVDDAAPEGEIDPRAIDDNLGRIMDQRNITLEAFLSPERQAEIIANAPGEYAVGDISLRLHYRNGNPIVYEGDYAVSELAELPDELTLPDLRPILFRCDNRKMTITQLRKHLGVMVYV